MRTIVSDKHIIRSISMRLPSNLNVFVLVLYEVERALIALLHVGNKVGMLHLRRIETTERKLRKIRLVCLKALLMARSLRRLGESDSLV